MSTTLEMETFAFPLVKAASVVVRCSVYFLLSSFPVCTFFKLVELCNYVCIKNWSTFSDK